MNFFKKALVATAVVASFGASAAKITPSTTIIEISKEGIAANVAIPTTGFDLDVKVEAATPAASNLKIVFGAGVDLSLLTLTGTVTQTAGLSKDSEMEISFGTGSFTFDNFAVDTTTVGAHFVTFDVSLGQPMNVGAAFNVKFVGGASASVATAASATYTATDTGVVIDTGVGAISVEKDQFSFAVKTPLDKLINRTDASVYTDTTVVDVLDLTVTNEATLSRAITATGGTILLEGNFTGVTIGAGEAVGTAVTGVAPTTTPVTVPVQQQMLLTLDAAAVLAATNVVTVTTTHAGASDIPATGDVLATYTAAGDFIGGTGVVATKAAAGEWAIDATIINVPYLPVGIEGLNATVILSNEGASATDVIVTAIDADGLEYGPANLNTLADFSADLPAKTVSKVSDLALIELLSAPAGALLSVTFNIDANEGVVNGYAYTQKAGAGRAEVSTSQQRGN